MSFLSWLYPLLKSWPTITAAKLAACEPTMDSVLCPPQYGQLWCDLVNGAPLRMPCFRLAVMSTASSVSCPQCEQPRCVI